MMTTTHASAETPITNGTGSRPTESGPTQSDRIIELGDEIAVLAAHIHAANHRLLTLIARFDAIRGWEVDGFRNCADWLAFRIGIDKGAARERVRTARALEGLPRISAAMSRGELSFSKVRALTRVATPENERELLELARSTTAAECERLIRGWRMNGKDEAEREELRHRLRRFSVVADVDGTYVVRGRLEPEVGALLMRAIEAASDALYQKDDGVTPRQRRADALMLLVERAMAGAQPVSGTRAERYQVVVHVDHERLSRNGGRVGGALERWWEASGEVAEATGGSEPRALRSELRDGTRVSAETSRRLACDAAVVGMKEEQGQVLDVGRRTRTVPPALRRALEARDQGCVFPGCGLRFTDAHHVEHWADGGETSLGNLVLLCRHHHRLVHEGGFRVEHPEHGRPVFYTPKGLPLPDRPPRMGAGDGDPVRRLQVENGIQPAYDTCSADERWADDLPMHVVMGAIEALSPG